MVEENIMQAVSRVQEKNGYVIGLKYVEPHLEGYSESWEIAISIPVFRGHSRVDQFQFMADLQAILTPNEESGE